MPTFHERELDFLQHQLTVVEHQITRTQDALNNCAECAEGEGLERMLHAAELERAVLQDLLAHQRTARALSLDALIMQKVACAQRLKTRLSHNWRRGRPTPTGYWEAQSTHLFLNQLLRDFHAWRQGRPVYAGVNGGANGRGEATARNGSTGSRPPAIQHRPDPTASLTEVHNHPWYVVTRPDASANGAHEAAPAPDHERQDPLDQLQRAIYAALAAHCFEPDYFDVTAQPDGVVLLKGYVHNADERDDVLAVIMELDAVQEVLADLKILGPGETPPTRDERRQAHADDALPAS